VSPFEPVYWAGGYSMGLSMVPFPYAERESEPRRPMKLQNLRAINMTVNERTRAAIPNQGTRILSCRTLFSLLRGST